MKNRRAGFTLIELLITTATIIVLTGLMAKLWGGMERMSAAAHRNMAFTVVSRNVLDHMRTDIRNSIQVARSQDALLKLTQLLPDGSERLILYRMEGQELIRDICINDQVTQSKKVADMEKRFLEVSFLKNEMVRIQVRRRPVQRPLELKNHSLSTYVCMVGANQ